MKPTISQLKTWLESKKEPLLSDLFEFLRIPSISADPNYKRQLLQAHDWLRSYLLKIGFEVESIETSRYPILLAYRHVDPTLPRVLIYNHYDVQPADPVEAWDHPAFEPFMDATGEIFARGANDNKGQLWAVLQGIQALEAHGSLPCNLTLCIEGEEESGSVGIQGVLPSLKEKLKADLLFIVDVDVPAKDKPAVTVGMRGNISMTLELKGSNSDLHSGIHGGIVYNPNHALVEILAQLRDRATGRILIDGFYDDVRMPSSDELALLDLNFDEATYEAQQGAKATGGEKMYKPLESAWLRPTLEINGISGGYAGEGFKTVIPATAMAKISCRLVSNQNPQKMIECVKKRLLELVPEGIEAKLTVHGGGRPAKANVRSYGVGAVKKAYEEVLGLPCTFVMSGGSVPVTASLSEAAEAEAVFFGYGLGDDNIHAPNEHYGTDRLIALACIVARSLQLIAE